MAQSATGVVQKAVNENREAALPAERLDAEPGREGWTRETQALLRMAEIARKASEDARSAAAQTRFQNNSARAAEAAQNAAAESHHQDPAELRLLRDELAAAQVTLKERETALAKAHLNAELARESVMRETQALVQRAEQTWKAAETTRSTPPAAERREQSAHVTGKTTAQQDAAPMARARLSAAGERFDASALWEQIRLGLIASGYVGHVLAGACLAVVLIALYFVAPLGTVTSALEPSIGRPNLPLKAAPATPPKVASYQTAIVARGVNLRAYPSTNSQIIATLPQGLKVTMIEKQGSWTLIKATDVNGQTEPLVGWMSISFLNVEKGSNTKPSAPAGK